MRCDNAVLPDIYHQYTRSFLQIIFEIFMAGRRQRQQISRTSCSPCPACGEGTMSRHHVELCAALRAGDPDPPFFPGRAVARPAPGALHDCAHEQALELRPVKSHDELPVDVERGHAPDAGPGKPLGCGIVARNIVLGVRDAISGKKLFRLMTVGSGGR
jgi:hypothetical protein